MSYGPVERMCVGVMVLTLTTVSMVVIASLIAAPLHIFFGWQPTGEPAGLLVFTGYGVYALIGLCIICYLIGSVIARW